MATPRGRSVGWATTRRASGGSGFASAVAMRARVASSRTRSSRSRPAHAAQTIATAVIPSGTASHHNTLMLTSVCGCSTRPGHSAWRVDTLHGFEVVQSVDAPRERGIATGLRRADPLVGAVAESLVLPDRDGRLELVDQVPAGVDRLAPMRRADADDDRDVADRQLADPMHRCDPDHTVGRAHLLGQLAHPVERARVRGVRQALDRLAAVVIAHRTHEHRQPARARIGESVLDLVDAQRLLAERECPDRVSHELKRTTGLSARRQVRWVPWPATQTTIVTEATNPAT